LKSGPNPSAPGWVAQWPPVTNPPEPWSIFLDDLWWCLDDFGYFCRIFRCFF
jgi:hypothetical protein